MHYYIDGYNLMFRVLKGHDDFSTRRKELILQLNERASGLNLHLTLVFDAQFQEDDESRSHFHHLEILFTSKGETADEFILKSISQKAKNSVTVVTSDKKLAFFSKHSYAKTETIDYFLNWLNQRYKNINVKKISKDLPKEIKKKQKPGKHDSIKTCFNYYLEQFEKETDVEITPVKSKKKLSNKKKPIAKEEYISEFDRWLKLFSEKDI